MKSAAATIDPGPIAEEEQRARSLQRYVARHNRQALLLALCSLAVAVVLWSLIYVAVYWFSLVAVTVSRGSNLETFNEINRPDLLSPYFPWWFALGAALALAVAGVTRRHLRVEQIRDAYWYLLWVLVELFLAVPNVTFAILGNLAALCRLRRHEAVEGWLLLRRMNDAGGRLSLAGLRMEFSDERTFARVLLVLQIVGLVGVREYAQGWFLCLQSRDVLTLLGKKVN